MNTTDKLMTKAESAKLLSVLDGKVTRTELLDLVQERLREEHYARAKVIENEQEALTFDKALARKLVTENGVLEMERSSYYDIEDERSEVELTLTYKLPFSKLPATLQGYFHEKARLDKLEREERDRWHQMNGLRRELHLRLVREALNSSPEGQKVLAAVEALKTAVGSKLLTAYGKERE